MLPSTLRAIRAQTLMELRLTLRRGESVLLTLIVPPVLLAFLGTIGPLSSVGERSQDALVAGILSLAIISSSMVSLGIATAFERYYGVLKRLGSTPLPRSGLICAKIGAVIAVEVVQVVLIALVAVLLLDWRTSASWLAVAPALLLGTVCFASLGLLMAGTLRAETTLALANGLYLLFLLIGGLVLPIDALPPWLQPISRLLPTHAFDNVVQAALLRSSLGDSIGWLLAWTAGLLAAAVRFFRWE